jgi:hypothetical protein
VTELERALVLLGRELELPPTPDLAAAVRPRLARRLRRRWVAAVALAVAAVALAFAVPGSRGALLRFFHLRGATVELVETLPALPGRVDLGRPVDPGSAPFRLLLLDGRAPDAVYAADGGYWLRYRGALLFELRDADGGTILKKVAGADAPVRWVTVGGDSGVWIGARHGLYLPGGAARTAGRTLLWQHGELTLRLEADAPLDEAIRLALSLR